MHKLESSSSLATDSCSSPLLSEPHQMAHSCFGLALQSSCISPSALHIKADFLPLEILESKNKSAKDRKGKKRKCFCNTMILKLVTAQRNASLLSLSQCLPDNRIIMENIYLLYWPK